MVVTRRAPAAPAAARTGSTQSQRIAKARATAAEVEAEPSSSVDDTNDRTDARQDLSSTPKKGKQKWKGKQKKGSGKKSRRGSLGLVDLLARALLLWFTIYTLSICPEDDHLKSPVCRALYHYRRLVLEPYIYPPVQAAFAHPAIAPYVDAVKPHYNQFIATTKPVVTRTQSEWNQRVVPQWNKRVVPQWKKRVVPQWNKRVSPQLVLLQNQINPYLSRVDQEYQTRIAPHLNFALSHLNRFQNAAEPYVVLAAHKSHEGFQAAKPYARPVWEQIKVLIHRLLAFLAVQRRQFVDPHVAQMWDKVTELGSGKSASKSAQGTAATKAKVTQISSSMKSASSKAINSASGDAVGAASSVAPAVVESTSPVPSSSSTVEKVASSAVSAASVASSAASSAVSSASSIASSVAEEVVSKASSVLAPTTSSMSSAASSASRQASSSVQSAKVKVQTEISAASSTASTAASSASSIASTQAQSIKGTVTSATSAAASTAKEAASSTSLAAAAARTDAELSASLVSSAVSSAVAAASAAAVDDDEGLAAFYEELGLSNDGTPLEEPPKMEETEPTGPPPETEEEKAARLAAIAEKRADIAVRHSKWEKDVDDAAIAQDKELRAAIAQIRAAAAAEFESSSQIDNEIDSLVKEADKLLKGVEGYLKNLAKEKRGANEKASLWVRVTDKVDEKFNARLRQTEQVVNTWYGGVVQKELLEVEERSKTVADVADAAQADVGLDYVWLEDVTYHDWQRYHDLARRAANFTQDALMIQNGTHPTSLENPVVSAIQGLENEVKDVVAGFQTRLRRIRRSGDRTLLGDIPVEDGGVPEDAQQPTVSILPVPDEPGVLPDAPPIVIGRGKGEVLEALGRVEASEATETLAPQPDDATKAPEELVGVLAEEAAAEAAEVSPLHVEL